MGRRQVPAPRAPQPPIILGAQHRAIVDVLARVEARIAADRERDSAQAKAAS